MTPAPHEALDAAARGARRILLTGPIDPDGDSIGACLALARALRLRTGAQVVVAGDPGHRYALLPDAASMVPDALIQGPFEVAIVLDGDRGRLEAPVAEAFEGAAARGIIDHHRTSTAEGYELAWIDPDSASTCSMVDGLLQAWQIPLDPELATLLYAGLAFDTGCFRHANTTPATHLLAARLLAQGIDHAALTTRVLWERSPAATRLAGQAMAEATFRSDGRTCLATIHQDRLRELGATLDDLEGVVDALLNTRGVEVAGLVVEGRDGGTKVSLRSRREVDVAALARRLHPDGGGHARAAGARLAEGPDRVRARLEAALEGVLAQPLASAV